MPLCAHTWHGHLLSKFSNPTALALLNSWDCKLVHTSNLGRRRGGEKHMRRNESVQRKVVVCRRRWFVEGRSPSSIPRVPNPRFARLPPIKSNSRTTALIVLEHCGAVSRLSSQTITCMKRAQPTRYPSRCSFQGPELARSLATYVRSVVAPGSSPKKRKLMSAGYGARGSVHQTSSPESRRRRRKDDLPTLLRPSASLPL
ncbi:hypothetical protein BKA81DRAFT_376882 [Phyllosticta paracitricarpa]|uniref:Uncharacterized protein n=1 Tax=Phyllosticta citricarpa TaxID=55181 RepID=A0ABR1MN17_9PEZI